MHTKFITAFQGGRDYFEVPLALYELNMLECHVSDFYLPEALVPFASSFYKKALRRFRRGLPGKKVKIIGHTLYPQIQNVIFRRNLPISYKEIDRILSIEAGKLAAKTGSDLFLHSGFASWAFESHPNCHRWMYQYHPHPAAVYDILKADFFSHPEVKMSFETETDSQPLSKLDSALVSEWQLAEHIFCASTFTARSLKEQGCDDAKLHIVPYGSFPKEVRLGDYRAAKRCQFLFVGQGVQRKGLHHLLKAWKRARLSDCDLNVVCRKLDPGIAPLLDQPNIRFHSGASDRERDQIYEASDVFVLPSLVEGFGLVYLEALAAGLYCIGTMNTGLPDLHPPQNIAKIIAAGDMEGLTMALADAYQLWRGGSFSKPDIIRFANQRTWDHHRHELKKLINMQMKEY